MMGPKTFSFEWLVHHSQLVFSMFEAPAKSVFFPKHSQREYLWVIPLGCNLAHWGSILSWYMGSTAILHFEVNFFC